MTTILAAAVAWLLLSLAAGLVIGRLLYDPEPTPEDAEHLAWLASLRDVEGSPTPIHDAMVLRDARGDLRDEALADWLED